MTSVHRVGDGFVVDAALLAEAFGLTAEEVRQGMRDGRITSRCEAGIDEDDGRWRLTFHHGSYACRFIVDKSGEILARTRFPVRTRKPGVGTEPGMTSKASGSP